MRWNGTSAAQDSAITVGDSGNTSISLSGAGSLVGLTVDNGSNTGKVLDLKIGGTSYWGMGSSGAFRATLYNNTSRNGESNPYSLYAITASNSGGSGNPYSGTGTFGVMSYAESNASTSANVGILGSAGYGNHNVGIFGMNYGTMAGSNPRTFAVIGNTNIATATSYGGGHFSIWTTASTTTVGLVPSNVTAALSANNGDTTGNLLELQDNGTTKVKVTDGGNTVLSDAALSTSATDGFVYVPSCAGAPSGTPTTQTGTVPMVIDTTNIKIYAYIGGAWKSILLA